MTSMFASLENYTLEEPMDAYGPQDEALFEAHADLCSDHAAVMELHDIHGTMDQLHSLHTSMEVFGTTKSLLSFANTNKVLSKSIPAFAALEALDGDAPPDSAENEVGKKSVLEKIKEVSAAWFKKAWDVVSGWGAKIGSLAKAGFEKITAFGKWAAGKTWDGAKAAGRTIKAHPIASVLAIAAIAAGGFVLLANTWMATIPVSEAGFSSLTGFLVRENTAAAAMRAKDAISSGTATALGYTSENFTKLVDAGKNLFGEGSSLGKLAGFFKTKIGEIFNLAKNHTGDALKWAQKGLMFLISHTWKFITGTGGFILSLITSALSTFKGFFKGGVAEAAAGV